MSLGTFSILLLAIFTTEIAVMEYIAPLLPQTSPLLASLADAALLALLLLPPLCFFFNRLFSGTPQAPQPSSRLEVTGHYVRILAVVFLAQLLVMLIISSLLKPSDVEFVSLLDAGLTVIISAPPLYLILDRLEKRYRRVAISEYLNAPVVLYLLLLFVVFLADMLQELILPIVLPRDRHEVHRFLFDALTTTLILAPFLWYFVARPLKRSAQSERVRAEAVNDQVVDAIVTLDNKGRIIDLNPAAETIFGHAQLGLVGQPAALLFEEGQPVINELVRDIGNDSANRSPLLRRELTCRTVSGETLVMDVSFNRIQHAGHQEFLLIMRDISDRKAAEDALQESSQRFQQIFEQSEDAILFFKPGTYYIIDLNATAEAMFGYRREELRGAGMERLCTSDDFERLTRAIRSLQRDGSIQFDILTGRRYDGSEFLFSMRGKFMNIQGVDIVYCTFRDVTERVRMEQEARDIQSRLIQANKMTALGLMVSGVAHEINNPNNYIMTNAQLLNKTWDDAFKVLQDYYEQNGDFYLAGMPFSQYRSNAPKLFAGIVDGSRRINEIVNNLKKFARMDSVTATDHVDINRMATSAVSILQHELSRHTDNFQLELSDDLPQVSGSSQQLGQVVINLLMNACQSLPGKDRGIRLSTVYDANAQQVVIAVSDQGTGLTREDGRRIFEPFFTTKLDSGGTGLGLSICHSIITEHGGELTFDSAPDQGTTFTVRLPTDTSAVKGNQDETT